MTWIGKTSRALIGATTAAMLGSASYADLLVYEPFLYSTGPLLGQEAGLGFDGPWTAGQQGGEPTVYDETSASVVNNNAGGEIDWDGVVNNVPTTPGAPSARFIASGPAGTADRITANRILGHSAGALAGDDDVLWASVVWRQTGSNFGRHIGFTIGTDGLSNRSVNVDSSGNFGAGIGDAIGVGGGINTLAVTPTIWDNGSAAARTTAGAANVSTSLDNIVVLKFEFADGVSPDTVSAYTFNENVALLESTFNASAISASYAIDQDTFNLVSFSQSRGAEAIDEIRFGDTFTDVISGVITPPELSLRVDTITGAVTLVGDADDPLDINYYQITSDGDSLNATGWNSLSDQDYDGNGPADGSGNGWEEGAGVGSKGLAEAYLLGDSSVPAAGEVAIGLAYDAAVDAQDLVFRYRIDTGQSFFGEVEYVQTALPGDTDGDGDVDDSDLGTAFSNYTGPVGDVGKTAAQGDVDGDGDVDDSDLGTAFSNYTGPLVPANVPEPASLVLLAGLGLMTGRARRSSPARFRE